MDEIITADGVKVRNGDRVFDYYNGFWGVISDIDHAGWFFVTANDGRYSDVNGDRVCKVIPKGNPFYGTLDMGIM